jgi:hypothetical protein
VASEDLKRIVATQVASGHAIGEIAQHHGYTYKGMWKLANTAEVQAMVQEHRQHLQEVYTRTWFRFAEHGEALAGGMLEDAFNANHPKQFEARKYCLDQLSPAKNTVTHDGRIDVRVDVAAEVLLGLQKSIDKISEVKTIGGTAHLSPAEGLASHLRDGRSAIPSIDAVAEDGGPPPERKRTHDNGDLTHPATPASLKYSQDAQKFNNQGPPDEGTNE